MLEVHCVKTKYLLMNLYYAGLYVYVLAIDHVSKVKHTYMYIPVINQQFSDPQNKNQDDVTLHSKLLEVYLHSEKTLREAYRHCTDPAKFTKFLGQQPWLERVLQVFEVRLVIYI